MTLKTYRIDGLNFSTLEEFFDEVSRVLIPGVYWGKNLDAFNDILRGGFGTPDEGFILLWENSEISKKRLGYLETVRQLKIRSSKCHPGNLSIVREKLNSAMRQEGPTVFEWIVEIIQIHVWGGREEVDNIKLVLN